MVLHVSPASRGPIEKYQAFFLRMKEAYCAAVISPAGFSMLLRARWLSIG